MEYSLQRRSPASNAAGLAVVIALHVALVLGLMYGLTRSGVKISVPDPIAWVRPEEAPKPPPEPLPLPRSVVKHTLTPPPMLSEVVIDVPTPPNTISTSADSTATTPALPDAVPDVKPVANPTNSLGVACPNAQSVRAAAQYPAQARREGLQGDVLARFIVGARGDVRDIQIVQSSNRVFNTAVMGAVRQFNCIGQGQDVAVEVPFSFHLE